MLEIKKVAVLGTGVMGSQISAHLENAGIPSFNFDLAKISHKNRNLRNTFPTVLFKLLVYLFSNSLFKSIKRKGCKLALPML